MGGTLTLKSSSDRGLDSSGASGPQDGTPKLRHWVEFLPAWLVLKVLGSLPRWAARLVGDGLAVLSYAFWPRLRRVGMFNLKLAFPAWDQAQRRRVLRGSFRNLGRMLAEFARFPSLTPENVSQVLVYDGFEHFAEAHRKGRGVLYLTAHFGGWELGSFCHGVYGYPCHFVVRELDNPLLNRLIHRYRDRSGGRAIDKRYFARGILKALKENQAVGILFDQNSLLSDGVFVNFFGHPACTNAGLARLALKTGAPVLLSLVVWDERLGKYCIHFEPVDVIRLPHPDREVEANTALFTERIEKFVRRYPDQWLWMHRRWKTRPPGEPSLYPF